MNDMRDFTEQEAHILACELAHHPLFEVTRIAPVYAFRHRPWAVWIRQRGGLHNETFITCLGLLRAVTELWRVQA